MKRNVHDTILKAARIACHSQGPESPHPGRARFEQIDAVLRDLGIRQKAGTLRKHLKNLIAEGKMAYFHGQGHEYRPVDLDIISLGSLLVQAERHVSSGLQKTAGRRATVDGSRQLEKLSRRQFERISAAARKLARHLHPDLPLEAALCQEAGALFVWTPEDGPGGQGDWGPLIREMERASAASTRRDDVGAIRTLADLAATHGWISRSPRHDPDYQPVPAAWAETQQAWRAAIYEAGISRAASISLLLMSIIAERLGTDRDPALLSPKEWATIRELTEERMLALGLHTSGRSQLRRGFEALRAAGLVNAEAWKAYHVRTKRRATILPRQARLGLMAAYGRENRPAVDHQDRMKALSKLPDSMSGLRNPEDLYGLHRMLEHFTRPSEELGDDLPPRDIYPRETLRQVRPSTKVAWKERSLGGNLEMLGVLFGWMAKHRGTDWAASDLRELGDPEHVRAFYTFIQKGGLSSDRGKRVLSLWARVASPYLEAVAVRSGDLEFADRCAEASALASSERGVVRPDGSRDSSFVRRLQQSAKATDKVRKQKAKARRVEAAYTTAVGSPSAYEAMWRIFHFARTAFLKDLGVETSEALLALEPHRVWDVGGQTLRDLVYFQDQLMVPLRSATSSLITVHMRPWTPHGPITGEFPAETLKVERNGDMSVTYTGPPGSPSGPYDRALLELYQGPKGVRELELRARKVLTEAVYVPFGAEEFVEERGTDSTVLWTVGNSHFVQAVRRVHAQAVLGGLDYDPQFLIAEGVATTHPFRHALATWFCSQGRIEDAALLLHHSGLDMIRAVYSARTASDAASAILRTGDSLLGGPEDMAA